MNIRTLKKTIGKKHRFYFSKQTERNVLFFMTLAILISGLVCRIIEG